MCQKQKVAQTDVESGYAQNDTEQLDMRLILMCWHKKNFKSVKTKKCTN